MLCQSCGKNQANTHIKRIINGELTEYMLCEKCAAKMGYSNIFEGFGLGFDFDNLLGKPAATVPGLGSLALFLETPFGVVCWILAACFAIIFAVVPEVILRYRRRPLSKIERLMGK